MKLTVPQKLYGLVAMLLIVVMIVAGTSYMISSSLINESHAIAQTDGMKMQNAMMARLHLQYAIHWFKNYLLRGQEKYVTRYNTSVDEMKKSIEAYTALAGDKEEQELAKTAMASFTAYAPSMNQLIAAKNTTDDISEADHAIKGVDGPLDKALKKMDMLSMSRYKKNMQISETAAKKLMVMQWIIAIIASILGVGFSVFFVKKLSSTIGTLHQAITAVSSGDLSTDVTVKGSDEFTQMGDAFNNMVEHIRQMVGQINDITVNLSSASEEGSATTSQISAGTQEQLLQIEQGVAATTEVSQTIMDVAKNAGGASETARQTADVANEGMSVVEQCVSGMHEISRTVEESSAIIETLGENSKQIGEIINVINDIADQTNLLALNAAIEAARAGEQGRGFAVVADEVRKLAERTAGSTHEITEMIKKIQKDTDTSVSSMEVGKQKAVEGVKLVEEAKSSLSRIVQASGSCMDMVQSIAAATEEQSAAVEQVSANMENIANTSRTYQNSIAQLSSSAGELSGMSSDLKNLISWFRTNSAMAHANRGSSQNSSGSQGTAA